jgi:hypothetical protein
MERMAESLDLGEFLNDQGKYQQERYFSWCASKNLTPTAMGLGQWLMRAIGFKARDGGNERQRAGSDDPGSGLPNGVHSGAMGNDADPLEPKLTAYRKFLAANPRLAEEYLARQPARVQQAIREAGA